MAKIAELKMDISVFSYLYLVFSDLLRVSMKINCDGRSGEKIDVPREMDPKT